jgi:biotin operon repressor
LSPSGPDTVVAEEHTPLATPFPVVRASALQTPDLGTPLWLIENLWMAQAVGILGGAPKSCKTWLALEIAVSVASGSPCLGTFPVLSSGPVLLYAAEDSAAALRLRLDSLARRHQRDLADLDIAVITADSLRLDRLADQQRLDATLRLHNPVLLLLDPLVRLHAIDENAAGEVAALLGYLRLLQRQSGAAIALVHHARKNVSSNRGAGYSLRGSSDLYAWVDSFLYLRRRADQLTLSAEHRAAPGIGPLDLELVQPPDSGPYLKLTSGSDLPETTAPDSLRSRLLDLLTQSSEPRTVESLRARLQVRNQRLVEALRQLSAEGLLVRLPRGGYSLPPTSSTTL